MIRSFRHKGLGRFFATGDKSGIRTDHADRLRILLTTLDHAVRPEDLRAPSWRLHPLKGDLRGFWSLTVQANWRIVFRFAGKDIELVDYIDYH